MEKEKWLLMIGDLLWPLICHNDYHRKVKTNEIDEIIKFTVSWTLKEKYLFIETITSEYLSIRIKIIMKINVNLLASKKILLLTFSLGCDMFI